MTNHTRPTRHRSDRLVDTAQAYKSEAHVGAAIHESGLNREDVFIGPSTIQAPGQDFHASVVTKCISKTHGYESTLKGVDASLGRLNSSEQALTV